MNTLCNAATGIFRQSIALFGALALAAAAATGAAADYGPRTILGDNYHQTTDVTSPDGKTAGPCTDTSFCFFLFQRMPNGVELFARRISCVVGGVAAFPSAVALGVRRGQNFPNKQWHVLPGSPVNASVRFPVRAKEIPFVLYQFNTTGNITGVCSIAGDVITIP